MDPIIIGLKSAELSLPYLTKQLYKSKKAKKFVNKIISKPELINFSVFVKIKFKEILNKTDTKQKIIDIFSNNNTDLNMQLHGTSFHVNINYESEEEEELVDDEEVKYVIFELIPTTFYTDASSVLKSTYYKTADILNNIQSNFLIDKYFIIFVFCVEGKEKKLISLKEKGKIFVDKYNQTTYLIKVKVKKAEDVTKLLSMLSKWE